MICPSRVLSEDALADKLHAEDALMLSAPLLQEVARQLSDHVLAYFDKEGWMLAIGGDPAVIRRLQDIHFRPGVNWSEGAAGTNGPGTCLVEGAAVLVEGAEHYVAAWQSWSCSAVPLFLPGAPSPFGAIDVTGPWDLHSRRAGALAQAVALALQERLHAAIRSRDEVVRYAMRAAIDGGDALVAVDLGGRVLGLNDAATRRRLVDPSGLAPAVREALRAAKTTAALASEGEARLAVHDGPPLVISAVSYEGRPVGAILRVAMARSASAPRPAPAKAKPGVGCDFDQILGTSDALCRAVDLARTAARNALPVVVSGETGTGKEMFARSIHAASNRASERFVVMNCGAVPAALIEAELFGYEAGAFTGARPGGSPGRFEDADRGTLFLDEVSELPPPAQVALLRLLQEKEVVRLGSSTPRKVDVRIVAATNKPLAEEVQAGRFRRDLYYRLNVLPITVPPLRARGADVGLLARAIAAETGIELGRPDLVLTDDAVAALQAYDWPGNVRELRNVVQRAGATAPCACVRAGDLAFDPCGETPPPRARAAPPSRPGSLRDAVDEEEHSKLADAIEAAGWNLARAAQALSVSRTTLYRLMHKYGIARPGE